MSDEPKRRSWGWIGWAIVSLLALYLMSAGPAAWLWNRGYLNSRFMSVAYAPIDWSYKNSAAAQRIIDQYMRIWTP
ncbi:MAG TPA: hypothetical protein VGP63_08400 [Planctomycetaceae bacterium]|jgi:hypothetical protein|nr:hypothetical protein [Planctomycetaceae bacterium]